MSQLKTAVILAGGKGTRLRPFTFSLPKPLLPLDDTPILEVVIAQLTRQGIQRIVISVGYLSHLLQAAIGDGSRWGIRVEYVQEDTPLGTAGALKIVPGLDEPFLVMNGDLLTDLDFNQVYSFHEQKKATATIAVHRRYADIDYGVVEVNSDKTLANYVEKPRIPHLVSMGVNILTTQALEHIPDGQRFDMPELMLAIKNSGQRVACFETDCYWQDIGRIDDFSRATEDFQADRERFYPRTEG